MDDGDVSARTAATPVTPADVGQWLKTAERFADQFKPTHQDIVADVFVRVNTTATSMLALYAV